MAKKSKTVEETPGLAVFADTNSEPCWHRHPGRAALCCDVEIDLGGPTFSAHAEVTEDEESLVKDIGVLKRERLQTALEAAYAKATEYLNG